MQHTTLDQPKTTKAQDLHDWYDTVKQLQQEKGFQIRPSKNGGVFQSTIQIQYFFRNVTQERKIIKHGQQFRGPFQRVIDKNGNQLKMIQQYFLYGTSGGG
jgi:hypothetical protein